MEGPSADLDTIPTQDAAAKTSEWLDAAITRFDEPQESKSDDVTKVLDPNHPLLEKFQRVLKEYLTTQIERLSEEVLELETDVKKKNAQREELGVAVYEAQQVVNRQYQALESGQKELDTLVASREEIENELNQIRAEYKVEHEKLEESETKDVELRNELESFSLLQQQMSKWEADLEAELAVNQRIADKAEKDKRAHVEEKRKLDMVVYKLKTEIFKLESELEHMDMQLRARELERERLAEATAAANADLEALASEFSRLIQAWNSVVVAISRQDRVIAAANKELDTLNEEIRTVLSETERVKRTTAKEMERNEDLSLTKIKIQSEIATTIQEMNSQKNKRINLERQLMQCKSISDQTEKDLQRISMENKVLEQEMAMIGRGLQKKMEEKLNLEEQIVLKLQDQLVNDKASRYLNKRIKQVQEKKRELEITLANSENANAKLLVNIENQQALNQQNQQVLEDLNIEQKRLSTEENALKEELNKCHSAVSKKQRVIDNLNIKLNELLQNAGGVEMSPTEIKIKSFEKQIDDMETKNKELENFWLRQQSHIVALSAQRHQQHQDINITRKQIVILDQKNLKIQDELDENKKHETEINRRITKLQNKLITLNTTLADRRGQKDHMDKTNSFTQSEYVWKLQEAELHALKLEATITDLEEEKKVLSDELLAKNREALAWEKKLQMAVETKQNIDRERGEGGEIGTMRVEIHRMEVRYGQLKKAQEKLIHDLENCVVRRGAIASGAEAREKKSVSGRDHTRMNFLKKMDDARNKIKQLENDVNQLNKKLSNLESEEEKMTKSIKLEEEKSKDVENAVSQAEKDIHVGKLEKQKELEHLISKQHRLKMLNNISKGKFLVTYRSNDSVMRELIDQTHLNDKLVKIVEMLRNDFPHNEDIFTRILNTLKIPV